MVLVSSFPKSGTTWLGFLMYTCQHGRLKNSAEVIRNYPETLVPKHGRLIQEKIDRGELFFSKSHHPYFEELPYRDHIQHCIYLVRNPFDVMVSMLNHYQLEGVDQVEKQGGKKWFFDWFLNRAAKNHVETETDDVGGWTNHVTSWIQQNAEFPTSIVRYEDLRADTVAEISRLNRVLSLGFTEENIRKGCELASFENLKRLEDDELRREVKGMFYTEQRKRALLERGLQFINKGKVGNYKEILDEATIREGLEAFSEGMKLVGYL